MSYEPHQQAIEKVVAELNIKLANETDPDTRHFWSGAILGAQMASAALSDQFGPGR